jgi:hypothetical protein
MIQTAYNGSFGLDEIKKIIIRSCGTNQMFEIRLLNSKKKIFCCNLHSFLTESRVAKSIEQLKIGDKIWIDVSVFSADGSLK